MSESVEIEVPPGACSQPECTAAMDGICLQENERDPIDCDYFELTPGGEPSPEPESVRRDVVRLPAGTALHPHELSSVLSRRPAARVVPLGWIEAGKTTLFAVLFELLTSGRLTGWSYVRSATTIAFAERSHHASMRSNRTDPTTPRTSRAAGDELLHFDARRVSDAGDLRSVLLADVSGEHVDLLVTNGSREPVLVDALSEADHIPILVDGGLAAHPQTRQNAVRRAIDLVHVLADLPPPPHAQVSLVLTKLDCFADNSVDEVIDRVQRAAVQRLGPLPPAFRIAARPRQGADVTPGVGLAEFFEHVSLPSAREVEPAFPESAPHPSPQLLRHVWLAK